jgi:alpha-L-fucosidase
MKKLAPVILCLILSGSLFGLFTCRQPDALPSEPEDRMAWWRYDRFGMFIHWGLYAIPAGEWNGETHYGEWIRNSAQIPLDVYDQFRDQFNPVAFDAREWVKMAKEAGMRYIVITSKHHDGFCLWDSEFTDFDIMSTPYRRDIVAELKKACDREGIRLCFYHSIMDWHHPDYLPRRDWEKDRPVQGADFDRYVMHMKDQLRELIENYGPLGILWFDGEWESTWNHQRGKDLYVYVRGLQPDIIINNRVDVGREGSMAGFSREGEFAGDYGTPEQEVPATGFPGVDWETCMTMNDHWGYNKADQNWKSSSDLIRMLTDIASKGGNFLLNTGPTAQGTFPEESVERLRDIGRWMSINGEAIYGTHASPFAFLPWGRCTVKSTAAETRLYLSVFSWPEDGRLKVPGLYNRTQRAYLLGDQRQRGLNIQRSEDTVIIQVPVQCPDTVNTVVVLEIEGEPDVNVPPDIIAGSDIFVDTLTVTIETDRQEAEIRYTLDGVPPDLASPVAQHPVTLTETTTVMARSFRDGKPVSSVASRTFSKVEPMKSSRQNVTGEGIEMSYYEGNWDRIPDFESIKPLRKEIVNTITDLEGNQTEYYGMSFKGLIRIPRTGVYTFSVSSDDGSLLLINGQTIADNDGLHGMLEKNGQCALSEGLHEIGVRFFEKTGSDELKAFIEGPGLAKQEIPATLLFH